MTDLSIIIVSYRGWTRLEQCLEALNSFNGKNINTEVIIVDNHSDEKTIYDFKVRFSKFRFIFNKVNGGFANGCNLGAKTAEGNYFLFLNPDTIASESEIEKLLDIAKQNPNYTILSCRQINEKGKECVVSGSFPCFKNLTGFQRAVFKEKLPEAMVTNNNILFPDWISGSVVMISRENFQEINGFDEDFWMYYEDVDLCKRAKDYGGKVALIKDITIEHNHGGSSRINIKTTSRTKTEVHISRHNYISKHMSGINRVFIQLFLVINNLITGGLMAIIGLLFFLIPKVFVRTLIFIRLIVYYVKSMFRHTWISPMSVNSK